MKKTQALADLSRYYLSFLNNDIPRLYLAVPKKRTLDDSAHLEAASRWICSAQDASGDGGVARSYSIVYSPYFRARGWMPSYPETTGYIIPTMFDYSMLAGNRDAYERAVRMAEWESRVQLDNGAVQGGTIKEKPSPAIFNTGQVVFGWVRAFKETGDKKFLESALRAGDYLVREQDGDGAWRKNLSDYASGEMKTYTYNTRTAWALLCLYEVTDDTRFRDSALRNIEFALTQQLPNGWFRDNCLFNPAAPLLHTIAYAIRGVLEAGIFLQNPRFIDAAKKSADALLTRQRPDGSLAGRFDRDWAPGVEWSCLTGNAQTGIIWGRLFQVTKNAKYLEGLKKVNRFMKSVQLMTTGNPGIYGGISGSYPLGGNYGRYEVLNWAVKFYMDSLMMEGTVQKGGAL
ncbi:MAG TPA: prenyltransferase/squalene oxidase repeat-containing protein [Thermodesulfobacteriota bacterium]|nr:prenyltransferase/squalene oxidase repeat-containing protein [Thermodesulfobacteriota bacterium]